MRITCARPSVTENSGQVLQPDLPSPELRLYKTWFQEYFTHSKDGPVDGFLLDHFQMQDIITVAADRNSAKGRFRAWLAGGNHKSRDYRP